MLRRGTLEKTATILGEALAVRQGAADEGLRGTKADLEERPLLHATPFPYLWTLLQAYLIRSLFILFLLLAFAFVVMLLLSLSLFILGVLGAVAMPTVCMRFVYINTSRPRNYLFSSPCLLFCTIATVYHRNRKRSSCYSELSFHRHLDQL